VRLDGGHKILLAIVFLMCLILIASSIKVERLSKASYKDVPTLPVGILSWGDNSLEGVRRHKRKARNQNR